MHLDEQPVGAGGDAGSRERGHELARARRVTRVDDDREPGEALQHRDRGDVEGEARRLLEGTDAALAERDLVVAAREDVCRRLDQLVDGRPEAALEENGPSQCADRAQEREVRHVPGPDLQHVRVLADRPDVFGRDDLGDHDHAELVGNATQRAQPLDPQTLEAVGGRPRLVGAAAQDAHSGRGHRPRRRAQLLLALHRARTGHDGDGAPAERGAVREADHTVGGMELAARDLVRMEDRHDALDAVEGLEDLRRDRRGRRVGSPGPPAR